MEMRRNLSFNRLQVALTAGVMGVVTIAGGVEPEASLKTERKLALESARAASESSTMYVNGRYLFDRCGEKVILRGVNRMIWWMDGDGIPSFREIAKCGANSVRIQWMPEATAHHLDIAISNAVAEQLIPMVELHSATGKWWLLQSLVDYWVRPDIVEVIRKHEKYLLVNIGNEVGDETVTFSQFREGYELAVRRMRDAGIHVPLVIDAADYGKDMAMLLSEGPALIDADPDHNLVFSVHMWWPEEWGYSKEDVFEAIHASVEQELPLIVGEFGNMWSQNPSGYIPYPQIVEETFYHEVGMFPWSWGAGNYPQYWLDMTRDGTYDSLQHWGLEVAVTFPYSIQNTSVRPNSMVYGRCGPRTLRPGGRLEPTQ